jgi:hypothetical protein
LEIEEIDMKKVNNKLVTKMIIKEIDHLADALVEIAKSMKEGFVAIKERNELIDKEIKLLEENMKYMNNALAIFLYDEEVADYN